MKMSFKYLLPYISNKILSVATNKHYKKISIDIKLNNLLKKFIEIKKTIKN